MKSYAQLLQTPLRSLDFSPACLEWFQSAGVHTIEDVEQDITLLMMNPLCTEALLKEMTTVIEAYMMNESSKERTNKLAQIKHNHSVIVGLVKKLMKKFSV